MSTYDNLVKEVLKCSKSSFADAAAKMLGYINGLSKDDVSEMLIDIGAIPQSIKPSSSEEKLYSKVTDIVLSRCFKELGLDSEVMESRGNSADVKASSSYHGYSLVADSKAMRLSRTDKNQKDFKVGALGDSWMGDDDTFAVLCCPLYQYPSKKSQIYEQALNNKTCFISWEHLKYLIDNDVREDDKFSLEPIWSYAVKLSRNVITNRNANFFDRVNKIICKRISKDEDDLKEKIAEYAKIIVNRANIEKKQIIDKRIRDIKRLTKNEAIEILIEYEIRKTDQIDKIINKLNGGEDK